MDRNALSLLMRLDFVFFIGSLALHIRLVCLSKYLTAVIFCPVVQKG